MTLSDDELLKTVATVDAHGVEEAARLMRLEPVTVKSRLAQATQRGVGLASGAKLPPGLLINKVSTLYNAQTGEAKLQWQKGSIVLPLEDMLKALREGLADLPKFKAPEPPKTVATDITTLYALADLHLGMYSWAEETGNNYDVEQGVKLLLNSVAALSRRAEGSADAILLNLGDFFHSDSDENRTRRSGNALDVDTRYARVLRSGVQVAASSVQLLLGKHRRVLIRSIPGNHDPYGALALQIALSQAFAGNPLVTVDLDPGPFWAHQFGKVMLGAAHGDTIKPEAMPGVFAAKYPEVWGGTNHRYGLMGHRHTFKRQPSGESSGMQVEVFQTLAPRDAWGNAAGFVSGRSMTAITYHKDRGDIGRVIEPVGGPR